jgi:hypothetical protein
MLDAPRAWRYMAARSCPDDWLVSCSSGDTSPCVPTLARWRITASMYCAMFPLFIRALIVRGS